MATQQTYLEAKRTLKTKTKQNTRALGTYGRREWRENEDTTGKNQQGEFHKKPGRRNDKE